MSTDGTPLHEMTLRQLRKVASSYAVSRYSRMRKEQLIEEIRKIQQSRIDSAVAPPAQATVEASKFNIGSRGVGNESAPGSEVSATTETLADVDVGLNDLPDGYGESRIMLLPRDPQWAYVYWDIPNEHREKLRRQGGRRLALRFYDVTDIDLSYQRPHSLQQYECDEMAREWYVPIPVSDRDYAIEIGYLANDGRWLILARSSTVRVPPVYPSDWIDDQFIDIDWDDNLQGKTVLGLNPPPRSMDDRDAHGQDNIDEALRVAGSLFGSAHQLPPQSPSSHVLSNGTSLTVTEGGKDKPNEEPATLYTDQGEESSQFWLVASAELIVYGATAPGAAVTVAGYPVKLNSSGAFRLQLPFQDGLSDYPIKAVSADGEETQTIQMTFTRETSEQGTASRPEAEVIDMKIA